MKSPIWKFFHVVICVKPGVDESMLHGSGKITKGKIVLLLAAIIVVKSFGLVVVQWARVVNLLLSTNPTHP